MKNFKNTLQASTSYLLIIAFMFTVFEPAISKAIEDQFTVTQVVTAEISFLTPTADITMSPNLAGITGGTANGQTTVRVLTNNATGYNMTLSASSSAGMLGNANGGTIPAYVHIGSTTPQFTFTTPANTARFGYTVEASTTADLAQAFKDTGSICGAGSSDATDSCWLNATTGQMLIMNRTTSTAASGSTSTIKFRTVINANPVPAITQDTYVATTTLTAVVNP